MSSGSSRGPEVGETVIPVRADVRKLEDRTSWRSSA
jgi:hypothetical protein